MVAVDPKLVTQTAKERGERAMARIYPDGRVEHGW